MLELLDLVSEVGHEQFEVELVEENLAVAEAGLDSLLEAVDDVEFHGGAEEDEPDLAVLHHVKYFVEHDLAGGFHVVVDVLEYEQNRQFLILLKVRLHPIRELIRRHLAVQIPQPKRLTEFCLELGL